MKLCPNLSCPHRRRIGSPAEFYDEIRACSDCGTTLELAPEPPPSGAVPESKPLDPVALALWKRLAVTLLVPLIVLVGERILLPGVDLNEVMDVIGGTG